jgi:tetratricopeptide (TPR) repeat protein
MPIDRTTPASKEPLDSSPTTVLNDISGLIDKGDWKLALTKLDAFQQATPRTIETRPVIAMVHLLRARAFLHLGEITKAWAESDRAISLAKEAMEPAIEAEAQCVIANIHWKKGELDKALTILVKALDNAKRSKDERVLGIVSLETAAVHSKKNDFDSAEREYRDAILALEKVGDQRQLARAYNNFAHVFVYQGQWQKAEEMFLKCRRLSEKAGFMSIAAWAAFNRAEALFELLRVDEAKKELDWAMPVLERLGDLHGQVIANGLYCIVYAKGGNFTKAEEHIGKAESLAVKLELSSLKGRLLFQRALLHKFKGERSKAVKLFKEAKELFTKQGNLSEVTRIDKELKALT